MLSEIGCIFCWKVRFAISFVFGRTLCSILQIATIILAQFDTPIVVLNRHVYDCHRFVSYQARLGMIAFVQLKHNSKHGVWCKSVQQATSAKK